MRRLFDPRIALSLGVFALGLLVSLLLPGDQRARAQAEAPHWELRMATLAPRMPASLRELRRWNQELAERTNGQLSVRMYWGGSMGSDRSMVRKMRIGQLDGANLTSMGLGLIVRQSLVLQAPGIFSRYEQVDHVRRALTPELAPQFWDAGFKLMGFGDAGRLRMFSTRQFRRPSDFRSMRPWLPTEQPIFEAYLTHVGARGVTLTVGEVLGGLSTSMVDLVPASALVVAGLQWFRHLRFVSSQSEGVVAGGMVIRRAFYEQLPESHQRALIAAGEANHERYTRGIRRMDDRAYEALTRDRMQAVDLSPYRAEWQSAADHTRRAMVGRLYPQPLLQRVEQLAASAP